MNEKRIACPNCYTDQFWDGQLVDITCRKCSHSIPTMAMARALIHLFSAPAYSNPDGEDGYELLRWLDGMGWGDAMRIGRHDWVGAGCPVTIGDFRRAILTLGGAGLLSVSRLVSQSELPGMLERASAELAGATVERLQAMKATESVTSWTATLPVTEREFLYYILRRLPTPEAIPTLKDWVAGCPDRDGDPERSVGATLLEALQNCEKLLRPTG